MMFEKGTLRPQRFLTAVKHECPNKLEEMSRQLWLRVWSRVCDKLFWLLLLLLLLLLL